MEHTAQTRQLQDLAAGIVTGDLLGGGLLDAASMPDAPDGYQLHRRLGRGGAGEVFLAKDINLQRMVALKFLRNASAADIERFRREARFAARLESNAIVKVYALGDNHGQPYIVMQYLDGGSLRQAELNLQELLLVTRQVAVALEHAHAAGIVHRDIKPENILLDSDGRPYLSDFGIARDVAGHTDGTLSREGQIIGTPALMSPEQARGDIYAVDARTDIYALGATLYYKLTRQYPFEAPNVIDLLHKVMHEQPRLPRALDPSIPPALEALVMRCLAKRPENRFASMCEFCAELDDILTGAPVAAAASSPWFQTLISRRPEAPPRQQDSHANNGATAEPIINEAALEMFRDLAEWDANLYRVTGSLSRAFQRLDDLRSTLDLQLAERPDLAWARFCRGAVHYRRGTLDEAINDMEPVVDRVPGPAAAQFALGRVYLARYLRDHDAAQQHLSIVGTEESLASLRPGLEQAIIALKESQRLRGDLRLWHREYADAVMQFAEGEYDQCCVVCDRILDREPELEDVWKLRGDAQQLSGRDPFASYQRAVEIRRSFYEALYAMARAHIRRGQMEEAQSALHRAIEIHPEFTEAMAMYARTMRRRAGDDIQNLTTARDMAARAVASDSKSYEAAIELAEVELQLGSVTERPEHFEAALQTLQQAFHLHGCQNRVQLLQCRVWIERARQAVERDKDPEPMLAHIESYLDHESLAVPDNEPWLQLFSELRRIRALADK